MQCPWGSQNRAHTSRETGAERVITHTASERRESYPSARNETVYTQNQKRWENALEIFFWLGYQKWVWCFHTLFLFAPQNPLLISLHLLLVSSPNSSQSIFVLSYCLSYFFIAMMKYHDKGSLLKKEVIWAYGYRGLRSMLVEQRHGGRSRKLRAPILTTSRKQSLN